MENGGDIEGVDERRLSDTNFRPVMGIGNLSMSRVIRRARKREGNEQRAFLTESYGFGKKNSEMRLI